MENTLNAAIEKIINSKKIGDNIFYVSYEEYNNKIQKVILSIKNKKKMVKNKRLLHKFNMMF